MSSHDCFVRGSVVLVPGTELSAVHTAINEFLQSDGLDFEELVKEASISLEANVLWLHIPFQSWGGSSNNDVAGLAKALGTLCRETGYIELLDFDTGDSDEHCCPYFFGRTDHDKLVAQLNYGIEQMKCWAEHLVDPECMVEIERFIRAQSRIAKEPEFYRANLSLESEQLELQFQVPADSPAVMLDSACLAAISQKADGLQFEKV